MKLLCKCEGSRNIEQVGHADRIPLKGGGHTAFTIIRCSVCHGFAGFPQDNFDLALAMGTPAAKKQLRNFLREYRK